MRGYRQHKGLEFEEEVMSGSTVHVHVHRIKLLISNFMTLYLFLFRWTTFGIYLLSLVGMVAFSGFLFTRLVFCFISISALGYICVTSIDNTRLLYMYSTLGCSDYVWAVLR